jgi:hypothetical protein
MTAYKDKPIEDSRKCKTCGEVKSLDCFYSFKARSGNMTTRWSCKICVRAAMKKRSKVPEVAAKRKNRLAIYYQANKEKIKKASRVYRLANSDKWRKSNHDFYHRTKRDIAGLSNIKRLVSRAKARARKNGILFNITFEDIVMPQTCPALGIPLFPGEGCMCDNSPSIDRIVGSKGYTKGNVIIVSLKANRIKTDATPEEIMAVAVFYRDLERAQ